ncbi:MAG: phospholipase D family protein [Hydrogenophaga sp.]|uniref:phospholipase D family protein n=1 Tax=Hydrogenophaga sp. TaxID=1904254 RepID=UPI004036F21D
MINVDQRSLLTDALTPPPGFVFETGMATTFSLDLVTLLTLPLHLAWLGSAESQTGVLDPLPVLEALRRTAHRLTVYCHAGRMQIPRTASPLFELMEGMVHEAMPKHPGAFHPKVWLLKFVASDARQANRLRLLVLSRNLTDDRSWDLSLSLEGDITGHKIAGNQPLKKFLAHLPGLCRRPLTTQRKSDLECLQDEVHRCDWELPSGFDALRFHALGIYRTPQRWLPETDAGRWDELGVISPFVTGEALGVLASLSPAPLFLVCRPDEMDKLCEGSEQRFQRTLVLDPLADASDQEDDVQGRLSGLHAKAFVGKRGWNTHLFVGSANATNAALLQGHNVEFMAELIGRTSKVGRPESFLGEDGLSSLLVPYVRNEPTETDAEHQTELLLDALQAQVVAAELRLECARTEAGWSLVLHGADRLQCGGASMHIWPLSLSQERAVAWPAPAGAAAITLGVLAEQDLTAFTGFSFKLNDQERSFALNLPITGLPEGRDLSILRGALSNRDGFVRYLLLLLGNWEQQPGRPHEEGGQAPTAWRNGALDLPLFEMLTRAFSRDRERLVRVGELLDTLSAESADDARGIVPPEFRDMWKGFQQAMKEDENP